MIASAPPQGYTRLLSTAGLVILAHKLPAAFGGIYLSSPRRCPVLLLSERIRAGSAEWLGVVARALSAQAAPSEGPSARWIIRDMW